MKEVDILREIAVKGKNERLENVSKFYYSGYTPKL